MKTTSTTASEMLRIGSEEKHALIRANAATPLTVRRGRENPDYVRHADMTSAMAKASAAACDIIGNTMISEITIERDGVMLRQITCGLVGHGGKVHVIYRDHHEQKWHALCGGVLRMRMRPPSVDRIPAHVIDCEHCRKAARADEHKPGNV